MSLEEVLKAYQDGGDIDKLMLADMVEESGDQEWATILRQDSVFISHKNALYFGGIPFIWNVKWHQWLKECYNIKYKYLTHVLLDNYPTFETKKNYFGKYAIKFVNLDLDWVLTKHTLTIDLFNDTNLFRECLSKVWPNIDFKFWFEKGKLNES